ncbi:MAG: hypothetical protein NVSMB1_14220 [Polyangiales bacterium]
MVALWDFWKKGFDSWEDATARYLEQVLKSPLLLGPSGAFLTMMMKAKSKTDLAKAKMWGDLGLPTKRDQERALHLLNEMQSRLFDLEERLSTGPSHAVSNPPAATLGPSAGVVQNRSK